MHKYRKWIGIWGIVAGSACFGAQLAPQPHCPAQVQFSAVSRADPPEGYGLQPVCIGEACIDPSRLVTVPIGWAASIKPRKLDLVAVGFYYGPPEDLAQLKPDIDVWRGVSFQTTEFIDGTAEHRGYWMECAYGKGSVNLSQRLPDVLTQCTVVDRPVADGRAPNIVVRCK